MSVPVGMDCCQAEVEVAVLQWGVTKMTIDTGMFSVELCPKLVFMLLGMKKASAPKY